MNRYTWQREEDEEPSRAGGPYYAARAGDSYRGPLPHDASRAHSSQRHSSHATREEGYGNSSDGGRGQRSKEPYVLVRREEDAWTGRSQYFPLSSRWTTRADPVASQPHGWDLYRQSNDGGTRMSYADERPDSQNVEPGKPRGSGGWDPGYERPRSDDYHPGPALRQSSGATDPRSQAPHRRSDISQNGEGRSWKPAATWRPRSSANKVSRGGNASRLSKAHWNRYKDEPLRERSSDYDGVNNWSRRTTSVQAKRRRERSESRSGSRTRSRSPTISTSERQAVWKPSPEPPESNPIRHRKSPSISPSPLRSRGSLPRTPRSPSPRRRSCSSSATSNTRRSSCSSMSLSPDDRPKPAHHAASVDRTRILQPPSTPAKNNHDGIAALPSISALRALFSNNPPSRNIEHYPPRLPDSLEGSRSTFTGPESTPHERLPVPNGVVAPATTCQQSSIAKTRELYSIIDQVGKGTFGKVYKAMNNATGAHVALKRIRMEAERDGFPVTAMREIKILQSLKHENIVRLREMMISNGNVYMVFEYVAHDLAGVLAQAQHTLTAAHRKSLCAQLLAGLAYMHGRGVLHRDLKSANVLVSRGGALKLADFGLARAYQKRRAADYTNRVVTLAYRAPELLLGATAYGPEIDMWSAGCIMLELYMGKPVFQANDEIQQLRVIFQHMGTPAVECWPGLADLPWYELMKPAEIVPSIFRAHFGQWLSPAALDLAERLLAYDPSQRVSAAMALESPYFTQEEPAAALPTSLSSLEGDWHEFDMKRERKKKRRRTDGSGH